MTQVLIKDRSSTFVLDEDEMYFVCAHSDAYIEKACCSSRGSSGYYECGCGGRDEVICPADDCTGIKDWEIDDLFERLGGSYE